jgi:hypothetical protein
MQWPKDNLVIVLSVLLTASDYPFVIFWSLYCLSSLRLMITPLLSFGHCIVCPPYGFWLPLCYLLAIVLPVLLTASDYPFVIFWPLYCLSSLRLLITPLLSFGHCIACPPYGFWLPLCYLLATVLPVLLTSFLFLVTSAILNGGRGCRTQFWKRPTQGPSLPGLV